MSAHICHASGCNKKCHPTKLMCYSCWKLVPKSIQNRVYKHYTKGQCNNTSLIKKEWLQAARDAIKAVKETKR